MIISREWAMPNLRTFQIKPIASIIARYKKDNLFLDPFPYPYSKDCLEYLKEYKDNSVQGVLFDPPYSPRQLKECYDNLGMALHNTNSCFGDWKDAIARVIMPGGICISFGWSTNGLGKKRGFEILEILLVAHGGNHNDTIVLVEKKVNTNLLEVEADGTTTGGIPSKTKVLGILPNEL